VTKFKWDKKSGENFEIEGALRRKGLPYLSKEKVIENEHSCFIDTCNFSAKGAELMKKPKGILQKSLLQSMGRTRRF